MTKYSMLPTQIPIHTHKDIRPQLSKKSSHQTGVLKSQIRSCSKPFSRKSNKHAIKGHLISHPQRRQSFKCACCFRGFETRSNPQRKLKHTFFQSDCISNELIFFGSSSCWSGIPFDTRHSTQCVLRIKKIYFKCFLGAKMFDLIGFIYCYHFFLFKIFGTGGRRKGFPTLLINRSLPIK